MTASKAEYELLMRAPFPVSVVEGEGRVYALANPAYEQMVGRTGLVGRAFREVFSELPDDAPMFAMLDGVYRDGRAVVAEELKVSLDRAGDGQLVDTHFLFTFQPVRGATGEVTAVVTLAIDVSERRRLEEALSRSEQRLRLATEASGVGIWDYEPPTGQLQWDTRTRELFGLAPDAPVDYPVFLSGLHPDDRARVDAAVQASFDPRGGGGYDIEYRTVGLSDGVERWISARGRSLFDGGTARRFVGTVLDITERVRAGERLTALAAELRLMVDAGAALDTALDPDAMVARFLQVVVPAAADSCALFLREEGSAPRMVAVRHVDPGKEALLREAVGRRGLSASATHGPAAVVRTGRPELLAVVPREARVSAAHDAEHLAMLDEVGTRSALTVPLTVNGQVLGALTFGVSESARRLGDGDLRLAAELGRRLAVAFDASRLLEATQRERRRAEEANRAKDEFLSIASHELRTPLNAILGWARMLRSGALGPDKRERALETIERNARVQAQLVEDILDVSRIITGKLRLDVAPVDLSSVADAALDVVRQAADARGVRLSAVLDPDAGAVYGDAARLQQVVWNLLSNAVKFTPRGGRVQLRVRRVDSSVEVTVADDGQGIDPRFLPHVFEPFRQADASITRSHGGLGLGLAIVKHLVELHGGRVEAHSDGAGKGATFTVRVPVASLRRSSIDPTASPTPAPPSPRPVECPAELDGLRVLVVDDEPDTRELMELVLQGAGAQVTTACDAAQGFDALVRERPDVLVSDIGMPGGDGYALIRRVRALPTAEGGATPAIAVTAYAQGEDQRRALEAGFDRHLCKPVDAPTLTAALVALRESVGA
ncbi:MAG: ATP-binding protein [Polyangiales bacterium]